MFVSEGTQNPVQRSEEVSNCSCEDPRTFGILDLDSVLAWPAATHAVRVTPHRIEHRTDLGPFAKWAVQVRPHRVGKLCT